MFQRPQLVAADLSRHVVRRYSVARSRRPMSIPLDQRSIAGSALRRERSDWTQVDSYFRLLAPAECSVNEQSLEEKCDDAPSPWYPRQDSNLRPTV